MAADDPGKKLAEKILRRHEQMVSERSVFDSHWEEVAERILPRMKDTFFQQGRQTPGEKKNSLMFDATAALALERFASINQSILTPDDQRWHRIRSTQPDVNKQPRALLWFDDLTDIIFHYRYSPRANFSSQQLESYTSMGSFGSGVLFIDFKHGKGLRYRNVPLAECYFAENFQGQIDTVHRVLKKTARQIMQMVQEGVIDYAPEQVKKAFDSNSTTLFEIVHCTQPNDEMEYGRLDYKGMPWSSHYVFKDGCELLHSGGYTSWPYAINRHMLAPNEIYARSPAMLVLPNIKVLNEQKKTVLKMGHRLIDPVLLAYDDGILDEVTLKPGAVNYGGLTAQGQKLVQELYTPKGNLPIAKEMMADERQTINDAFYVTLFQILIETPRMTATEVLERMREKAALLAPTMGRQQSESLGPMIEREVDLLVRAGAVPSPPPEIIKSGGEYKVQYDAPMNRMMKAEEGVGFSHWLQQGALLAQARQDPSVLDWVNADAAMPAMADQLAVPAAWVNMPDVVEQIRQKREAAAATQSLIEAGPSVAALTKATQSGAR